MPRFTPTLSLLVAGALVLTGCGTDENSLLLAVTVDSYVQGLEVESRTIDEDGLSDIQRSVIDRDAASIAADPLRITVSVAEPRAVAVRIVTRDLEGRPSHSAFRCYQLAGVIEDTLALVALPVADVDGDGWAGDLSAGCGEPCNDYACPAELVDCDDDAFGTNPGALEDCGVNVNCNAADDRACEDSDGDGYEACPVGVRDVSCDCDDDARPDINPGEMEDCPSAVDFNCDGLVGDVCDNDMDGFLSNVDCDDADPEINPAATEVCPAPDGTGGGVDENCNGRIDELCQPEDLDGDGFLEADGDCDLCDPGAFPGAAETCGDGVDQDCSAGDLACGLDPNDADDDGVAAAAVGGRDCDDDRADVYPDAPERCANGADEDCDGAVDEGCPAADTDGDGYVETGSFAACEGDAMRTPGRVELCNGVDEDCDGLFDEGAGGTAGACVRVLGGGSVVLDYSTDLEHCGGCGVSCNPAGESVADQCIGGVCGCRDNGSESTVCDLGEICCQGSGRAGGCHDLSSSFDGCGACDLACDQERADECVGGSCRCGDGNACAPGEQCCGGSCVILDEDPNNCGACGARCGNEEACTGGLCDCYGTLADDVGENACTGMQKHCCRRHEDCRKKC